MKIHALLITLMIGAFLGSGFTEALALGDPVAIGYVFVIACAFFGFAPGRLAFLGLAAFWVVAFLEVVIPYQQQPFGGETPLLDKSIVGLFFMFIGCVIGIPAGLIGWGLRRFFQWLSLARTKGDS